MDAAMSGDEAEGAETFEQPPTNTTLHLMIGDMGTDGIDETATDIALVITMMYLATVRQHPEGAEKTEDVTGQYSQYTLVHAMKGGNCLYVRAASVASGRVWNEKLCSLALTPPRPPTARCA